MNWFDPNTRYPDGSYRHLPDQGVINEVVRRQGLRSENVQAEWEAPGDVAELLSRVHPNGAPSAWVRFFGGGETEEQERARIRTVLDGHKYPPGETGRQSELLARIKNRIENDLRRYAWLDSDHEAVVNPTPEQLAPAVSARAALDLQLRSINILLEQNAETERARVRYARDMHLCWTLADAIINATASFSDRFAYLLPAATAERIEVRRNAIARQAEDARQTAEAERLKQISEKQRIELERLAAVEAATLDDLLFEVFSYDVGSSVRQGIESRALTAALFDELAGLRETADPVRRRAVERLIGIGAEIMREIALKPPPTLEEIEAARQARLQAEEEARQKEVEARIKAMDEWAYPQICAEVNRLSLAPLEWVDLLPRVTDITRVTQYKQFFIEQTPRKDDPARRRVCELMAQHLGHRF